MKKLVLTALTVLCCGAAYALPVGNPGDASLYTNGLCLGETCCDDPCVTWCDMFSIRTGFYGDYVFNRHLQVQDSGSDTKHIDDTEIYTNAGLLVLNFCDWLDVFATFGATNMSIFTDGHTLAALAGADTTMVQLDFVPDFSWSIGGRATVWNCGCMALGIEGQYFQTSPNLNSMIRYESGDITYFNSNNGTTYSEWQVGIGLTSYFCTGGVAFVPYMALKWSGARWDMGDFNFNYSGTVTGTGNYLLRELVNAKIWGYAVGMTATLCDTIGVTVEGRFADEKAIHVNGQFRF